jgi:hypothetical protein
MIEAFSLWLPAWAIGAGLNWTLTVIVLHYGPARRSLDVPNDRSSHAYQRAFRRAALTLRS